MSNDQPSPPLPAPSSVPQVSSVGGLSLGPLKHLRALQRGRDEADAEAAMAALRQATGESS